MHTSPRFPRERGGKHEGQEGVDTGGQEALRVSKGYKNRRFSFTFLVLEVVEDSEQVILLREEQGAETLMVTELIALIPVPSTPPETRALVEQTEKNSRKLRERYNRRSS